MDEKTFFSSGDVTVTSARFMAKGQTYAMSGVTPVKLFQQDPSRKGPIILEIIGLLVMMGGGGAVGCVVFGLLLIGGAVALLMKQKPEFSVLLSTASGKVRALASSDGDFIPKVVSALNDAVVHRG